MTEMFEKGVAWLSLRGRHTDVELRQVLEVRYARGVLDHGVHLRMRADRIHVPAAR